MKSTLRAVAETAIFQAIVIDSKSRKRAIAVYACGTDVIWADGVLGLFDRDQRRPAPDWLKAQLKQLPANAVRFDWKGDRVTVTAPAGQDLPASSPDPADTAPVVDARGEDLGESSIRQG